MNVGRVSEGAPFDVRRAFRASGHRPTLLDTEAPATAHIEKQSAAAPFELAIAFVGFGFEYVRGNASVTPR